MHVVPVFMTRKIQNLKGCSSNMAAVVICRVVLFLAAFVIISAGTSIAKYCISALQNYVK